MKDTKKAGLLIKAYIGIEAVIFVVIKYIEITGGGHELDIIEYLAIAVNTVITAYFFLKYGMGKGYIPETSGGNDWTEKVFSSGPGYERHDDFIAYGLFMTAVADIFLTFIATEAIEELKAQKEAADENLTPTNKVDGYRKGSRIRKKVLRKGNAVQEVQRT